MTKGIQAELKQNRPFPTRAAELAVSISRTAAVLEHHWNETLRPYGLTAPQYNVLRILRGSAEAGLCGREVGERMINRVPDVTRMLDRMEAAGLITRARDQDDRRHISVRISALGLKRLEELRPVLDELEARIFGGLDDQRLAGLVDALDQVRSRV
jgi:DNA-binding MarR family transcriptional regulator